MRRLPIFQLALAVSLACGALASAHAELQTWQLTATVDNALGDFTPPAFARPDQTLTLSFDIDTDVPLQSGTIFPDAFKTVSIQGEATPANGYVWSSDTLTAIIGPVLDGRSDGIQSVSFKLANTPASLTVSDALNALSLATAKQGAVSLQIGFGGLNSVVATPLSFTQQVPEPSTFALISLGLMAVWGVVKWGEKRRSA
jgi:hypothetical protein